MSLILQYKHDSEQRELASIKVLVSNAADTSTRYLRIVARAEVHLPDFFGPLVYWQTVLSG